MRLFLAHPTHTNPPISLHEIENFDEEIITDQKDVGILIINANQVVYANPYLLNILEYTQEEVLSWKRGIAKQIIFNEDIHLLTNYNLTTELPHLEFRIIAKSGKIKWVSVSSKQILSNHRLYAKFTAKYISEDHQVFDLIQESEEKYRKIFQKASFGIITMDIQGNILSSNQKYRDLLDLFTLDTVDKYNLLSSPILQKRGFVNHFHTCVRYKREITNQVNLQALNGKNVSLEYTLIPLLKNRQVSEVICNVCDISHLQEKQNDLQTKNTLFRKMVEIAPFAILIIDKSGKIDYVNKYVIQTLGNRDYTNSTILDMSKYIKFPEFQNKSNLDQLLKIWNKGLEQIQYGEYKHEFLIKTLTHGILEVVITLSSVENKVFVTIDNVSERRKKQKARLQMLKLESLNMLAGGIAHDFNNILVGIVGNISLLQMNENLDEETRLNLKELEKATYRAKGLTNQLLTFSKGGNPIKKPNDLVDLVKNTISLASSGSNCVVRFESEFPSLFLNIDAGQIQQVINNILINAIQSMPTGGIIEISTYKNKQNLPPSLEFNPNGYLILEIKDRGPGIPEEIQDYIFEPYFTTKKNGNGLGLASSLSIIRNHDGIISFQSKLMRGTSFLIYLPLKIVEPEVSSFHSFQKTNFNKNALIMDDDQVVAKTLKKMLEQFAITADIVNNGFDAIERYSQKMEFKAPYDIVFLDLTIPGGLGGKETLERIHAINPDVVAIVSSGYSHNPIMANYQEFGFHGVLAKPYTFLDLKEKLFEIFSEPSESR